MRTYQRFLQKQGHVTAAKNAHQDLQRLLASAPGILVVDSIESHLKGGYAVVFELTNESLDSFISYMDANGWFSAM
jgi:hypothetical protein